VAEVKDDIDKFGQYEAINYVDKKARLLTRD